MRLKPISPVAEEDSAQLKAVREHFRCPQEFLDFRIASRLSREAGYFQFGPETIGYGRCVNGAHQQQPGSSLGDLLPHVSARKAPVVLPFDPTEVIEISAWSAIPAAAWESRRRH